MLFYMFNNTVVVMETEKEKIMNTILHERKAGKKKISISHA